MSGRLESLSEKFRLSQNRLSQWRRKYPLSRKKFRDTLYGQQYSNLLDLSFDVMISNPHIFKHSNLQDFNRKQERASAAKMVLTMHKLRPFQMGRFEQDPHAATICAHSLYHFDPGFSVKCDISFFLYGKTVYNFASKNPIQQKIAKQATSFSHIGGFGLTQLGHGSNVKGILTQAIYDHKTKEFIMHSPCKQAMKFWIGATAQLATMSVIWAQLTIDGVQYGPQPFIVPLRDPLTHQVYKGVTIGDCGNKNGANNIDNGYLLFDNYRIPKDYCLDRLSGVDENGKFYNNAKNIQKLFGMYMGPLSMGRAFIAINPTATANNCLAAAIRYVSTRRQFTTSQANQQQLLIDYPSIQNRIIPLLAQNLIYFFGGINLITLYDSNLKQLLNPSNKIIQQLHAITGPCKAKTSWFVSKVITECRQVCGGHGYSSYSGFARMYHGQDINTTWEGDNNMLLQQTTKYILKIANKLSRGKTFANNTLQFLTQTIEIDDNLSKQQLLKIDNYQKILKIRVRQFTQQSLSEMIEQKNEGILGIDIWNNVQSFYGNNLSLTFGDLYYLQNIKRVLPQFQADWREVIQNCTRIWMMSLLLQYKWGSVETRKNIQQIIVELTEWMTPRCVSIIDAMVAPSFITGSVFADEKGEGMKNYITKLFTGKKVFERVPWADQIIRMRKENQQ